MPQGCGCGTSAGGGSAADVVDIVAGMAEGTNCIGTIGSGADRDLILRIAPGPNNLAQCTSNGLVVSGDLTPTFCSPPDLATPYWIADGLGPMAPWGSEAYLDAVLAHNLDGIRVNVWMAPDGVFVWGLNNDDVPNAYYFTVNYMDRGELQPSAPSADHGEIDSGTWRNTLSPAGNGTALMPNNTVRQVLDQSNRDGDGGWWGWGAAPFSPMTLQQALDRLACRSRAFLELSSTNMFSVADQAPRLGQALTAMGRTAGVVAILTRTAVNSAQTLNSFGVATAVRLDASYSGDGSDLVSNGFTYAIADPDVVGETMIATLAAAGLSVIAELSISRHYKTAAALGAGASGVLCKQPVYARNYADSEPTNYFMRQRMLYDYNRHHGTSTERGDVDHGYAHRGQPGRVLYVPSPTTTTEQRQRELLLGDLDIGDPNNWEMSWVQSFSNSDLSIGDTQYCGVFWGNTQDSTTWPARATSDELAALNGYLCVVRISTGGWRGNLLVVKYSSGTETVLHNGTSIGALATQRMGLRVTPSAFTFINYTTSWTVNRSVTIDDPDYRGQYVWAIANTNVAIDSPLAVRFRNFDIGSPT